MTLVLEQPWLSLQQRSHPHVTVLVQVNTLVLWFGAGYARDQSYPSRGEIILPQSSVKINKRRVQETIMAG